MQQCLAMNIGLILGEVPAWLGSIWSVLLLVLGFSLVIFVHEMGHFLAAKWAGVRVEKFAIGFGKELFGFTRGETRYCFNVLPLGGYVKMLGQEDFVVDKSGELKVKQDPNAFTNKSVGRRMVIISAGVIMNLLFAAIAFTIVVMVGRIHQPPVVGYIKENSPAARAGLQTGDRILDINGQELDSWGALSSAIALSGPDELLKLTVQREGEIVQPAPIIRPEYVEDEKVRQIGVGTGQNLRVARASIRFLDESGPMALHKYDELLRLGDDDPSALRRSLGAMRRAILAARGDAVDLIVNRPNDPDALTIEQALAQTADIEATEARVQVRATWLALPYEQRTGVTGSLLGLTPRLTVVLPIADRSFELAGAQPGDVITRIGANLYPTFAELRATIQNGDGKEIPLEVRRSAAENLGLSGKTIAFCAAHREEIIAAARENLSAAPALVTRLAQADGLDPEELTKLQEKLADADTSRAWRQWLERVDIHTLTPLKPKKPFALFTDTKPTIDAQLWCLDEDHLVVANIVEKFGDRSTPAYQAGIPRGAVILAVDGRPVKKWYQLSHELRAKAGKTVEITYRLVDDLHKTKMVIPNCIQAALGLTQADRIIKINDKSNCMVEGADGKQHSVALPDWRAARKILDEFHGRSVDVEYVTVEGVRKTGRYEVTADNVDPWLDRVRYSSTFECYPLLERHPIHNPVLALQAGVRQAYRVTIQTIQTIRHLVFTHKVGFDKVSGPVGIVRMGSQVAESGMLNLLFFLGIISANLAVINFLPMPIVDGGLFLFLILEKIRGEPVSIKTQIATQLIGIALIATVFLLVTYQDILNWITGA